MFLTSNRFAIIGGTGDGKTTLAMKVLAHIAKKSRQKVVILNPMMEPVLYEHFGESSPGIDETWPDVQHVAPTATFNKKKYDRIWIPILKRGNVLLYIDELFIVGTGNQYGIGLQSLYQAGRRRNIGIVAVTQRPRTIPPFTLKMADHFFVGNVMGDDLKAIENDTNQRWREIQKQRKLYEFIYWSRHEQREPRVVKL